MQGIGDQWCQVPPNTTAAAIVSRILLNSRDDSREMKSKPAWTSCSAHAMRKRHRPADHHHQERQDENAACRIGGKRMHRDQHARAHQEGSEET